GTLSDKETRAARLRAKAAFNPLWERDGMSRSEAYSWLAALLGIAVGETHIGVYDVAMFDRVVAVIQLEHQ
ncbi:zinc-finger-containing protein, partial [Burkholderia pseudomallei]